MKKIPLTQGKFAIVDEKDYACLICFKWWAHLNADKRTFIPVRHVKAIRNTSAKSGWTNIARAMHEEIMGTRKGYEIDHRDRNPLNCRRRNMRWATKVQNCQNRARFNKWGFKGVSQRRKKNFRALITVNGNRVHLGTFQHVVDAARAYDVAAIKYFGEFACVNFPKSKREIPKPI